MTAAKRPSLTLEQVIEARGQTSGTRVQASGRCQELSGSRWAALARLRAPALKELATLLADGGFFDLPARIDPGNLRDGSTITWTASLDGRSHTVTLRHGGGPVGVPALAALEAALQRLVGDALDAEAEG